MKFGGVSWSKSQGHKPGILTKFKCISCNRVYKQEWTKRLHEKLCKEHFKEEDE